MFSVLLSLAKGEAHHLPIHASPKRKNLLNIVYKQYCTKQRVNESYRKLKNAFKKLHDDYMHIKGRNIFSKYIQMQQMICEVIILDKQYWQLINIPAPEPSEAANDYGNGASECNTSGTNSAIGYYHPFRSNDNCRKRCRNNYVRNKKKLIGK
uniref:MADF domain-containing protein n=1 Tax=Brugia malayi TaxID=6279 RepID=A0A7I4KJ07_BRUMA